MKSFTWPEVAAYVALLTFLAVIFSIAMGAECGDRHARRIVEVAGAVQA